MTRRRLFAVLFAALVARFLPKPKPLANPFEANFSRAMLNEGEIINEMLDELYIRSHPAYFGEVIGDTISIRLPAYIVGRRGEAMRAGKCS